MAEIILQFFAILTATLIGVQIAFLLDGWERERLKQKIATSHLRSLKSEIETNKRRSGANHEVVQKLKEGNIEGDHYLLEPLETDAWRAALEEPILGTISDDLYSELQERYSSVDQINSLIEMQRSEMHHDKFGESVNDAWHNFEYWTIIIHHYNYDKGKVDTYGLGPLVSRESEMLRQTDSISEDIGQEIDLLENLSFPNYFWNRLGR